ncbi:hypothetical protein ACFWXA_31445 [Streptomyces atroolivaceus]|uniref:hypothetical protein n=1 Tax=Streptomyces atroolivaceus TaxID=66869 RepID=UPI003659BEFA
MARTERQTDRQAETEYVCPTCKQPVATVLARHKTLGIFVPHWGPGPCHNHDCRRHQAESGNAPATARDADSVGR